MRSQRSVPIIVPAAVVVPGQQVQLVASQPYHHGTCSSSSVTPNFLQQCKALIPAEVRMISGCEDEQTSDDVSNLLCTTDVLPNPLGRAGGACTSALLDILHHHHSSNRASPPPSFQQVLMELRQRLQSAGHSQIPQLTSSRPLDLDQTPFLLGNGGGGRQRALLVGIRYRGHDGELRGCHNDVRRMRDYLVQAHGVPHHDILILMDDHAQEHHAPTRGNIIRALRHLVAVSQPGDSVVFHYSGHGGLLLPDQTTNVVKQKHSQYDQTLMPLDYRKEGHIRDFHLFHHFVQPMKAGVAVTCIMDCCHSGSVLELPYSFLPTNTGRGRARGSSERYTMMQQSDHLTNLAFLYLLAGGGLPSGGILDGVLDNLQQTLGDSNLEDYQGAMNDELQQDIMASGIGVDAVGDSDVMGRMNYDNNNGFHYGDTGGLDDMPCAADGGDYYDLYGIGDVVGRDVVDDNGGGWGDPLIGGGVGDSGYGDDEGCGDQGCGDLLSSLADFLSNDS